MKIKLVKPDMGMKAAAEEFRNEFFAAGEKVINGGALLDTLPYEEWLRRVENNSNSATVDKNWAVAETYFGTDENNRIVGIIDFRHNLATRFLNEYGGHVGYSVRPSERRKGYCTQMLLQIKAVAASLGLPFIMLGLYKDNLASLKTIIKCGGRIVEEKPYADGKPMYKCRIDL